MPPLLSVIKSIYIFIIIRIIIFVNRLCNTLLQLALNVYFTKIFSITMEITMAYYIEPKVNNSGLILGFSEIKKTASRQKELPENAIEVKLNKIKYDDYLANPANYYISGTTVQKVGNNASTNE